MVKTCFGACIGFVGGLLIGWIITSFVMDPGTIVEFQNMSNISIILIAGIIGLFVGLAICYITKKDKEESVFS